MTTTAPSDAARNALGALLRGDPPPGGPADYGPWRDIVREVGAAAQRGGPAEARRTLERFCAADGRLRRLMAGQPDPAAPWEPPLPLLDQAAPPPFPTRAFPSWLREYVERLAVATQVPVDLPAMLALAALGVALGRKVRVLVRPGWTEPVNLFVLITQPPGSRKSSVFSAVAGPLLAWERRAAQASAPEIARAQADRKMLEGRLNRAYQTAAQAKATADRQAAEAEARDLAVELASTNVPAAPRLLVDDITPERLAGLLAEQGGRLGVLSPEGTLLEVMAGRYSRDGAPNLEVFLKGHAGDDLRVDRVGRPPEHVERPALTIGLAVQPDVLAGMARRPTFRARGLEARMLYAVPRSLVGRRQIDAPPVPADVVAAYHARLWSLLDLPAPPVEADLVLTPRARQHLQSLEAAIEPRLGEGGDLHHIADWASKFCGAVARIAGLLHMAEHDTPGLHLPIAPATMDAAISIGQYLISHALAAFGQMGADERLHGAARVWRWIEVAGLERFTKRELFEGVKGVFRTVEALAEPLALLVEHGYIRPAPNDRRSPGRPSERFEVNPMTYSHSQYSQYSQNPPCSGDFANFANYVSASSPPPQTRSQPSARPSDDPWAVLAEGRFGTPSAQELSEGADDVSLWVIEEADV